MKRIPWTSSHSSSLTQTIQPDMPVAKPTTRRKLMAQLAIKGGSKTFDDFWPAWPVYTDEDKQALIEVL